MTRTPPSLFIAGRILLLTMLFGSPVLFAQKVPDRTPPTAPTNLVVTATTETSVSLAWDPSTDNSRFNYNICCAGGTVTVSQKVTSHTLEGLQPGKTYDFRVVAKDAAGNVSQPSNVVTVTLPGDVGAPTKPVVTLLEVGPTHAKLTWSSTDNGQYIWYSIHVDGEPVNTLNSRTATFTCAEVLVPTGCIPLDQEMTYMFTVQARDIDGNFSPVSDPVLATTAPADPNDRTPPTQPIDVTAENDGAFVVVRWAPSTDDLAPQSLIRYDVYVNDELRAVVVGETTAQIESDYGVENNIAVIAVDTADNESAPGTTTVIH